MALWGHKSRFFDYSNGHWTRGDSCEVLEDASRHNLNFLSFWSAATIVRVADFMVG